MSADGCRSVSRSDRTSAVSEARMSVQINKDLSGCEQVKKDV